ncbi:hypothetical protein ADQ49_25500 [Salmonella enterica subsp. enterica]|nr:hypothetical protein [Salmonella enterica subsp. enterica serovar Enteritidis]
MPVSVVGVNISKTGNYTILITVSRKTDAGKTLLTLIKILVVLGLEAYIMTIINFIIQSPQL